MNHLLELIEADPFPFIGAVLAAVPLGVGAVAWFVKARRERPFLSFSGGELRQHPDGRIGYRFMVTNTGKRTAHEIRFRTRCAAEGDLETLVPLESAEWTSAATYEPGRVVELMRWPRVSFASTTFMQIVARYRDRMFRATHDESHWFVIFAGTGGSVRGMQEQERQQAERAWGARWSAG